MEIVSDPPVILKRICDAFVGTNRRVPFKQCSSIV